MDVPEGFTPRFLDWFRERTEAAWPAIVSRNNDRSGAAGCAATDWRRSGTRWLGGLTDEQIADVERRWSLRFPPDYRLFLRTLHSVEWVRHGEYYTDPVTGRAVSRPRPTFYNWLTDGDTLQSMFAWLWEGLQFDVEHNALWPASWGPKPATLEAQKQRVRELVEAAPKLIPIFGHRYLLAEPYVAGNPVFSVYQSDIIVYGADLRGYLLREFADLLGLDQRAVERETAAAVRRRYADFIAVPFWDALLEL